MRRARAVLATLPALGAMALTASAAAHAVIGRIERIDPATVVRPGSLAVIDGATMHVIEQGSGSAVVLVHGFGGGAFNFEAQAPAIAERHRAITVELPGWGLAGREADADLSLTAHAARLRTLLDRLGIERAAFVGHSLGGAIVMRLAASAPERVERLAIVSAPPPDERPGPGWLPLLLPLATIIAAIRLSRPRRLLADVRRAVYDPAFITPERFAVYYRPWRLRGTVACVVALLSGLAHDRPLPPAAVGRPVLLLYGEADPVAPLRVAHRLMREMPDARLDVVPRAGHLVLEEQPGPCTDILLRFLEEPRDGPEIPAREAMR